MSQSETIEEGAMARRGRIDALPTLKAQIGAICLWNVSQPVVASPGLKSPPSAQYGEARYAPIASAIREGTCTDPARRRCLMAHGRARDDKAFTAASWDDAFGTHLRVCRNLHSTLPRCVQTLVTDRGPAKVLWQRGRPLDLSQAAFQALAPRSAGVIEVSVEAVP